ncbi:MAG: O-antigen ligase family protein, partial [Planctomycetota bacterium]
ALQAATACLGALTVATWRTGAVPAAWRAAAIAAAGFALASVVLTKSRTVLAGMLIGMGIIALARGGWRLAVAGAWGGVFLCGVGVTLAGMTTIDLGKTGLAAVTLGRGEQIGTLTGRSAIWAETTRYVADRPWRGHGYAAFWDDEKRREKIWDKLGWPVTSSHSQWIDTTLELGLVGATLLALLLLSAACRAVRRGVFGGDDFALFAATLLLALIFNSFMESHLFVGTRYMSWVFVAVVLKLTVFADDDRTLRDPTATPIAAGLSP